MKRLAIIPVCLLVFALCACGNPCAKGHSYVASEEGCRCERCGEVIEHSLTPTEDGCLCEICGERKAHTFIAEEEHCVCEVCGYATAEHEFESKPGTFVCANCGEEESKRDFLINYILENGEEYSDGKLISHTLNSTKNAIIYVKLTGGLAFTATPLLDKMGTTVITVPKADEKSGKTDESIYSTQFTGYYSIFVMGTETQSNFKRGMELKNAAITGDDEVLLEAEESAMFLAAYYIEQCMDGAQAVLDHYDLDITLADLGFVNFK